MYFVPDGTKKCGFYECKKCDYRFLSLETTEKIACPICEEDIDYEIGPDECLEDLLETAILQQVVEGDDVERMDALLSVAYTDDESWIQYDVKNINDGIYETDNNRKVSKDYSQETFIVLTCDLWILYEFKKMKEINLRNL